MHYHLGVFRMLLLGFLMSAIESSGSKVGGHSKEMVRVFENRLLEVLGLRSRPRPRRTIRVPDYMMELYRARERDEEAPQKALAIHRMHSNLPALNSNTARSFTPEAIDADNAWSATGDILLRFDVSTIPSNEVSRAAELRVFRGRARKTGCHRHKHNRTTGWGKHKPAVESQLVIDGQMFRWANASSVRNSRRDQSGQRLYLQVFDVLKPTALNSSATSAGRLEEPFLRLLDTRELDLRHSGWETLDVFPALQRWRQNRSGNQDLLLRLVSANGRRVTCTVRISGAQAPLDRQPILVTYTDDGRGGSTNVGARTKRNTHKRRKGRRAFCRRHALYVDFNDVGWNDWIVAPPGYHAFYCNGECPFPLADHLNSTNHAIVQTLVNSVNPKAVPRACCVPTELSPISLLYLDAYEKVVLKNYQDMVVEGCGCR